MDDNRARPLSLTDAVRAARISEAERTGVVVDLRDAELARLEILADLVKPVFADIPAGIDLFDTGLVPGATPRFFVDMIAFVEMGRDKRTYRFLQDTRYGRRVIVESAEAQVLAERITAYVAERLVARERMLAEASARPAEQVGLSSRTEPRAAAAEVNTPTTAPVALLSEASASTAETQIEPAPAETLPKPMGRRRRLPGSVLFILGVAAGILAVLLLAELVARP
ncbi:hypothetical protein E8L99_22395 [Phreatobacter aquaticus]|uniref:Uncharacterized protein n=1 Tax=Phreatobacter aquaticus TaxID=2570229 RepID=A0A4D7QSX2_9HYPH|nr:hypothetical protein [Phreatobacter aquaticus]QCK88314.1 hypothetical protein E8L99_22395 [Phreatobacter aquaticus]